MTLLFNVILGLVIGLIITLLVGACLTIVFLLLDDVLTEGRLHRILKAKINKALDEFDV